MSLLERVEDSADRIRSKYLAIVHDLGNTVVAGRRVIEHLAFDAGFSFWWMTLLAEKSLLKSPEILNALRFLALEEVVLDEQPERIELISDQRILKLVISDYCRSNGIEFVQKPARRIGVLRGFFATRPHAPARLRAVVGFLRFLWRHWPLRKLQFAPLGDGAKSVMLVSYFVGSSDPEPDGKRYESVYWPGLPRLIEDIGFDLNWSYVYLPTQAAPGARDAMRLAEAYDRGPREDYGFVASALSLRLIWRVARRWFWLGRVHRQLRGIKTTFVASSTQLSLWPILRRDWIESLRGKAAVDSLFAIELLEATMQDVPEQRIGIYPCEGQGWERALVHTWRTHGNGTLIGIAHSSVRYWDLRYFCDSRSLADQSKFAQPRPDLLAVNGRYVTRMLIDSGYPSEEVAECEALRFDSVPKPSIHKPPKPPKESRRVLVIGDYTPRLSSLLLEMANQSMRRYPKVEFIFKPHPVAFDDQRAVDLGMRVTRMPISEALSDVDLVLVGPSSAALDAYLRCIPLVVAVPPDDINFSPLRGVRTVRFVRTPSDFEMCVLDSLQGTLKPPTDTDNYLFIDAEMPRWHRLLTTLITK